MVGLVFSYLSAKDVQRAGRVCRQWNAVANDPRLWLVLADLAEKYCLSMCSCCLTRQQGGPRQQQHEDHKRRFMLYLPDPGEGGILCANREVESPLRSLLRKTPLRDRQAPWTIVLFGSGLEVPGSGLVSRLMWGDRSSPFTTLGAFPGTAMGIGGGVRLAFKSRILNLITLYRHNKTVREQRSVDGMPVVLTNNTIDNRAAREATLSVCQRSDAIVYVHDATLPATDDVVRDFHLLVPAASEKPLLVLLLVSGDMDSTRVTCNQLMNILELHQRKSRWWILTVDGFSFNQLERGFEWLLPKPWC